jgi:hypothetical protein
LRSSDSSNIVRPHRHQHPQQLQRQGGEVSFSLKIGP